MIKILFIHHKLVCGGAEQALYDLLCLMDKTKFDITVLVQCEGGVWEQKFRDAGIKIIYYHSCQISSRNPFIKLLNFIKRKRMISALDRDGNGLIDSCFSEKYDIIVSYFVWKWMHIGLSKNAKSIYYIHGDAATNQSFGERLKNRRTLLKEFDRIVCVSKKAANSFMAATGISSKIHTFMNPLNDQNVRTLAQKTINFPQGLPVICAVGRLSPEKAFDRLIFAHKHLMDKGIAHKLVIVGDGPEEEHLHSIIRGTKTENSVLLAGYTDNPYPYMKQSHFLVCSSYTEGLPVISMEAISLGIPIVSSAPSIGELFGDEPCGLITGADDDSLEAGIEKMLTDEAFYRQAKSAAERRSRFFNGQRMVQEVEQMYIDLLKEP